MTRLRNDGAPCSGPTAPYIIRLMRALRTKGFSNKEILERIRDEYPESNMTIRTVFNFTAKDGALKRMSTNKKPAAPDDYIRLIRIWWDRGFSAREIADKLKLERNVIIDPQTVYTYVGKNRK